MERQIHGFNYEQKIAEQYGIVLNQNYTAQWDGIYNDCPCSIKLEKLGSDIELADIFRNMNICEDFYLFVGFWEQDKNNIIENYCLYIPANIWKTLFNFNLQKDFKNLLANITNQISDDLRWKEEINLLRSKWKQTTPNLIRPRFKRDHKNQKRIQCAINNKDFYNYFVKNFQIEVK